MPRPWTGAGHACPHPGSFPHLLPLRRRCVVAERDPDLNRFLEAVTKRPGARLSDLVADLSLSPSAASRRGTRLVDLGLLVKRKEGRSIRFYLHDPEDD